MRSASAVNSAIGSYSKFLYQKFRATHERALDGNCCPTLTSLMPFEEEFYFFFYHTREEEEEEKKKDDDDDVRATTSSFKVFF